MKTWTQGSGLRTHGTVKINTGDSAEVPVSDADGLDYQSKNSTGRVRVSPSPNSTVLFYWRLVVSWMRMTWAQEYKHCEKTHECKRHDNWHGIRLTITYTVELYSWPPHCKPTSNDIQYYNAYHEEKVQQYNCTQIYYPSHPSHITY